MFYSTQILAKKGPLGTIWIAAHLDRRLKRHQVFEANIAISVDTIINPEAPLALRLSGQLLLGVVKVYSKKVGYLFQDCNDALVKVKQAFKPEVDLPKDGTIAAHAAITLPVNFNSVDFLSAGFDQDDDFGGDAVVPLKMGKRDSFLLADDISLLLGSQSSLDGEERFEVSGDEMERHLSLSLGEPEQLRRAMTPASEANLYVGDATPGSFGEGDEQMEAPPDDMFPQLDSAARPPSVQEDDMHVDTSFEAPIPDDLGGNLDDLLPDTAENQGQEENLRPAAQRARKGERKKRVQLDVGPDHRPATQLDGQSIRALLKDRAPLLRPRQALAERPIAAQRFQFDANDLAVEDGGESLLMQPLLTGLPPALRGLCMPPAEASPAAKGRKSRAAAEAEAQPDHIEATPAQHDGCDAPDTFEAPGDMPDAPMDDYYEAAEPIEGFDYPENGAAAMDDMQDGAGSPVRSTIRAKPQELPGDSVEDLGALEGGQEAQGADANAFTARTTHVAARLKAEFGATPGHKKRRLQSGAAAGGASISLDGMVEGRTRVDACRWFFEVLVLKSRDYVELEQPKPYGDISIRPTSRLLAV
ncbi:hypothetical protein CVIRNUC_007996 [Coccomyxa viridis]|uniref:Uncharacterized protein n=1 Tax=Coccomyxa viridis TaxID=1274662 RepID=A0AAV1IDJ9_9CHLO|nr:hypothetical protein CVIRNUC_007996 [Coccomyxa viridis]